MRYRLIRACGDEEIEKRKATSVQIDLAALHSRRQPRDGAWSNNRRTTDEPQWSQHPDERDPPFFFQKPTDSIVRSGATVPYPPDTQDFQFEVELVVAISRAGLNIGPARAPEHILIGIELTRRDRQREIREKMLPWSAENLSTIRPLVERCNGPATLGIRHQALLLSQ